MSQAASAEAPRTGGPAGPGPGPPARGLAATQTLARTGPPSLSRSEIENIHHPLPYLSYPGGQLAISEIPVPRLWDGSRPVLLYLPDRAVENYRIIRVAFGRYFDVSVCCPIKACYVCGMLAALRAAGAGAEVASDFEWWIARRVGFPPERIVANGVCRPARQLDRVLSEEVMLVGVDGEEELERICCLCLTSFTASGESNKVAP